MMTDIPDFPEFIEVEAWAALRKARHGAQVLGIQSVEITDIEFFDRADDPVAYRFVPSARIGHGAMQINAAYFQDQVAAKAVLPTVMLVGLGHSLWDAAVQIEVDACNQGREDAEPIIAVLEEVDEVYRSKDPELHPEWFPVLSQSDDLEGWFAAMFAATLLGTLNETQGLWMSDIITAISNRLANGATQFAA